MYIYSVLLLAFLCLKEDKENLIFSILYVNYAFWSAKRLLEKKNIRAAQTWKYSVLDTAYVILGGYEQINKLLWNDIWGELSICSNTGQSCASCPVRANIWHTAKFTYWLRLVATCLLAWAFVIIACSLTTFHGESASCFVHSLVLLPDRREMSILAVVIRPWLFISPRWDQVWELLLC